jgi:plastocyanin
MLRQPLTEFLALLLAIALVGCTSPSSHLVATANSPAASATKPAAPAQSPGQAQIGIDNFTFTPATITVAVGTNVTWTNHDDIPHTVTSTTGAFDSKAIDTDASFSFVFVTPGTYPYYCEIHPHMRGQVIVK